MGFLSRAALLILCSLICSSCTSFVHGSRRNPRAQHNKGFLPNTGAVLVVDLRLSMQGAQAGDLGVRVSSTERGNPAPSPGTSFAYNALPAVDHVAPLGSMGPQELVAMKDWRLRALWVSITGREPFLKKPLKHMASVVAAATASSGCTEGAQSACRRDVMDQQKRRLSGAVVSASVNRSGPSISSSSINGSTKSIVYEEEARQVPGGPDPLHHSDQPTSP